MISYQDGSVSTYGRSDSLNLYSRPEDMAIITPVVMGQ